MPSTDPFLVLNVPENADDAAIRKAYLDLVRRYPPETHPQKFQAVADAYRAIQDSLARTEYALFGNVPERREPLRALAPEAPNARRPLGIERWLRLLAEARHAR